MSGALPDRGSNRSFSEYIVPSSINFENEPLDIANELVDHMSVDDRQKVVKTQSIPNQKKQMKTLFGIRPYKIAKDQSPVDNSEQPHDSGPPKWYSFENIGNYFWVLLFGWMIL